MANENIEVTCSIKGYNEQRKQLLSNYEQITSNYERIIAGYEKTIALKDEQIRMLKDRLLELLTDTPDDVHLKALLTNI